MASQLESLQHAFAEALDDAEHVTPLLAHMKPVRPSSGMGGVSANPDALSDPCVARQRIGIYRGNVHAQWRAALANAYPVLEALVGQAYFDALSRAYAREYPSQSGDLHRFGARLPDFIEEYERDASFRYFADIARLEWALHTAYFAADVTSLTTQHWLSIGEHRLLDAQLVVHPACMAIASRYAIADIWLAHRPGGIFPENVEVPTWCVTVRPLWQPTVLVHSAAAHAAFMALQCGRSLNEALDAAYALDPAFDFALQWKAWILARVITSAMAGP
jgi:hypothetical protein